MADNTVPNSAQITEEDYKKLCKQVRQYQMKNGKGRKKSKPILKPIGQTVSLKKDVIVQQNPIDWDDIPVGAPFSLDPNGVLIYTKAGISKALCLNTMSTVPVGGASVYRVFL